MTTLLSARYSEREGRGGNGQKSNAFGIIRIIHDGKGLAERILQKQRRRNPTMNKRNRWTLLVALLLGLVIFAGCDSGEKALDEVTGNRAVKQYHKSKKKIEDITERQAERYQNIPDEEKEEGK
jgi:hypothetical protein